MQNTLAVGLGEMQISRSPQDVLVAYGLGSCLGIGMYDPVTHIAGLLHAVLPNNPNGSGPHTLKYVDSGMVAMLVQMLRAGAERRRLVVRMAGGANMLTAPGFSQTFNIGTRNAEAAYKTLAELNMKLSSQEVGGSIGRTLRFYIADGRMTIRTVGNQEREI
ncbi:MAG: chemotaxis protein CheD [Chloroflexi bacterium]|nr:chemotaxis protein CheD [Chloroflexota bacterium]